MFLQTVVLPFCIHATIPTNTTLKVGGKEGIGGVTSENLFKCFIVLKDMGYLCFVVIMGYPFIHEGRINPFNVCSKIKTSSD